VLWRQNSNTSWVNQNIARFAPLPVVCAAILALVLCACDDDSVIVGELNSNSAPTTRVTAAPPSLQRTSFEVGFSWGGHDLDGEVVGFEWRISDNGRDGIVDPDDLAGVPWHFTSVTDSVFVVSADTDSFPPDLGDPLLQEIGFRFWQTHTFYVRSVDDDGARDPSPAEVSFTATTLAPVVIIRVPPVVPSNSCRLSPQVMSFEWFAWDPDAADLQPTAVRYLLTPAQQSNGNCLTRRMFREGSWIRGDDADWSAWMPYDGVTGKGIGVTLPRQEVGDQYLFAVQVRDKAGAVSPTFEWDRNVRHVRVSQNLLPTLLVDEPFLGAFRATGPNGLRAFDIAPGQPLEFSWIAAAESYSGIIQDYRFGWDIADPNNPNDDGWSMPWGDGVAWRRSNNIFHTGTHFFTVQCRDNSGTISRLGFILTVVQTPAYVDQRPLLYVDDWHNDNHPDPVDIEWDARWMGILRENVAGFVETTDILEAGVDAQKLNFGTLVKYKGVLWFTNASTLSFLSRVLAPSKTDEVRYNWLEVYQARVGNLLMVGPGAMVRSLEINELGWIYPLFFDSPADGRLGFGVETATDGLSRNRGTTRWPYTAWCLDALDRVRPATGGVYGEFNDGVLLRSKNCDGLHVAELTQEFKDRYPAAPEPPYSVRNLEPRQERQEQNSLYAVNSEEFYNRNTTTRSANLFLRPCQTEMFRWVARRDYEAWFEQVWFPSVHPDSTIDIPPIVPNASGNCVPPLSVSSPLKNASTAIASSVYSDDKPVRGSQDFLWGFHPLSFQLDDVKAAVLWILGDNWELEAGP